MKKFIPHYFVCSIFYMELVLALSTQIRWTSLEATMVILFSAAFGVLLYQPVRFCRKPILKKIIVSLFLFLLAMIYMVIYFVYCEFRLFYAPATIFMGAGDAVDEFSVNIWLLLCSFNGVSHVLLFLAPMLLYAIFLQRKDRIWEENRKQIATCILMGLAVAAGCFGGALGIMRMHEEMWQNYTQEYMFDTAVARYGLLTALRLDYMDSKGTGDLMGGDDDLFQVVSMTSPDTSLDGTSDEVPDEMADHLSDNQGNTANQDGMQTAGADGNVGHTGKLENAGNADDSKNTDASGKNDTSGKTDTLGATSVPEEPVSYGVNALDIDFEALAETTSGDLASLDRYVASLTPSSKNAFTGKFAGMNLILLTAEAFTAEVIDPDLTPTLYRLATKGIQFTDFYQPSSAGTTGGEYNVLMGMYPTAGGSSMKNTATHLNYMTVGTQLDRMGYYGKAYHNNSYTYYDRHKTHINLGYSDGFTGKGNGMEDALTKQWPESDLEMMQATFDEYKDKEPFNIYYMTVSGHSLYSQRQNAMARKHWDEVKDLPYSDTVKSYIGSQLELEAALTYLVEQLEANDMADRTVICLCADHFPYGLDSDSGSAGNYPYLAELYGTEITNNLVRDHNRLILWSGALEKEEPIVVDTPVSGIDILPTLLNLFGAEFDSRLLPGRDVFSDAMPLMFDLGYNWKTDLGVCVKNKFVPYDENAEIPEDYVKNVRAIVKNKITFCKVVLNKDYYRHVFGAQVEAEQKAKEEAKQALEMKESEADDSEEATEKTAENMIEKPAD